MGKDPAEFPAAFATRAAAHVRSGRRLVRALSARDAMSPLAQSRHGFVTQALPGHESGIDANEAVDALRDDAQTPPPAKAAFRIDFPRWMQSLPDRKRAVAEDLMAGGRTQEVAPRHGLSQGRISQLRTELLLSWRRFHNEPVG